MKLYIKAQVKNPGAISSYKRNFYVNVESIIDFDIKSMETLKIKCEDQKIISYKLVSRLDGSCLSIEEKYYQERKL